MRNTDKQFLDPIAALASNVEENVGPKELKMRSRGLPEPVALRELVETYLKAQHEHWPILVKSGIVPKVTREAIDTMAKEFRSAFLSKQLRSFEHSSKSGQWKTLGCAYVRYSDANSNTRSLDQQLKNVLNTAQQHGIFIPWQYVFADAAVSGTTAARNGYQMAKSLMQSRTQDINCLVIDEIGRASRDAIEALKLGQIIEQHRKRMIGATDGFDSSNQMSKLLLHVFAMLHEFFVDQLSAKVKRGMDDAFKCKKNVRRAAPGYKLVPRLDEKGDAILNQKMVVDHERVIDEVWAPFILKAFQWYTDESWAVEKIASKFNENVVNGNKKWDGSRIIKLLERELYLGIEYEGKTRKIRDPETGKVTIFKVPKEEWKRREVPDMRIVPEDLWERTQAKRLLSRSAYTRNREARSASRSEVHHKSLVRPYCGCCQSPMSVGRTGTSYMSYFCENARTGKKGCKFRGYKSARIIDTAVLEKISETIFSDEFIQQIVEQANAFLSETKSEDKPSSESVQSTIRSKQRKVELLQKKLDEMDDTTNLDVIFDQIQKLSREIETAKELLRKEKTVDRTKLREVTLEDIKPLLADLRGLLQSDIGTAAPFLASMTSKVYVTEEPTEYGEPEWRGRFSFNVVPALLSLAIRRNCPTACTWEYLNTGHWTIGQNVDVWLKLIKKSEKIADAVYSAYLSGVSINELARRFEVNWDTIKEAIAFAKSGGKSPCLHTPSTDSDSRKGRMIPREQQLEVVRLRDEENYSFELIGQTLGIAGSTASSTYKRQKRADSQPERRHTRLDKKVFVTIEKLLDKGLSNMEIAKQAGCSPNTVRRFRLKQSDA